MFFNGWRNIRGCCPSGSGNLGFDLDEHQRLRLVHIPRDILADIRRRVLTGQPNKLDQEFVRFGEGQFVPSSLRMEWTTSDVGVRG